MVELYEEDLIPTQTINEILESEEFWSGIDTGLAEEGRVFVSPTLINPIIQGGSFRSSDIGARLEIFPEWDPTIGLLVYDDTTTEIFKVLVGGTDVGDVIMGDYDGGKGAKWDKSASTFKIKGTLETVDGDIGGLTITSGVLSFQNVFGDGSDGTVDINSGSFSSGPISSNALTRDAFFDDLTLSGGNLNTAGYRLFVKGTLTTDAGYLIQRNGNTGGTGGNGGNGASGSTSAGGTGGTAGSGAAALANGTLHGSIAGAAGTVGAAGGAGTNSSGGNSGGTGGTGTAGTNATYTVGDAGGSGGSGVAGGAGGGASPGGAGAAGSGGSGGTATDADTKPRIAMFAIPMVDVGGSNKLTGSGGTGSTGGAGGGGSGDGANVPDNWGRDAGGGGGGGSGGSGGNGGLVVVLYNSLSGSGSIEAPGGDGGAGGSAGSGGSNSIVPPNPVDYGGSGGGGGGSGGTGSNGGTLLIAAKVIVNNGTIRAKGGTGGVGGVGGDGGAGGNGGSSGSAGTAGSTGASGSAGTAIQLQV